MMTMIGQRIPLYVIAFAIVALPTGALADNSSVEDFTSIVNTGAIKQTTSGSNNRQDLNVGSANSTKANSFNATVTTGSITQSSSGTSIVQITNIGSANNAKVGSFNSTVNTGKIEQVSTRSGDRQELDIGSVNNSTVNGAFKVNVNVKEGVKQTGSGEIVLGSVKNSNVQDFSTNIDVKGKVTGNNIRIGSIVGGERFDGNGNTVGSFGLGGGGRDGNTSISMPSFSQERGNNYKPEIDLALSGISEIPNPFFESVVGVGKIGKFFVDDAYYLAYGGSEPSVFDATKEIPFGIGFVIRSAEFFYKDGLYLLNGGVEPSALDVLKEAPFIGFTIKGAEYFGDKVADEGGNLIFNYVVGDVSGLTPEGKSAVYSAAADGIGHVHDVTANTAMKAVGAVADLGTGNVVGATKNVTEMGITLYDETKGNKGKSNDLFERTGSLFGEQGSAIGATISTGYDLYGMKDVNAIGLSANGISTGVGVITTGTGLVKKVSDNLE
ncbi:MAG: hypothetical protein HXX17_10770 [Geobacteraceae bacterium]|nr:hypothetical protein [Geobacteraceae bacterium]